MGIMECVCVQALVNTMEGKKIEFEIGPSRVGSHSGFGYPG